MIKDKQTIVTSIDSYLGYTRGVIREKRETYGDRAFAPDSEYIRNDVTQRGMSGLDQFQTCLSFD